MCITHTTEFGHRQSGSSVQNDTMMPHGKDNMLYIGKSRTYSLQFTNSYKQMESAYKQVCMSPNNYVKANSHIAISIFKSSKSR